MRILHPHKATGLVFQDQNGRNRLAEAVIEACAMDDFSLHGCGRPIAETEIAGFANPETHPRPAVRSCRDRQLWQGV